MAITVKEMSRSRPLVDDPADPSGTRMFWARSDNLAEESESIESAVLAECPDLWLGMVIKQVKIDPQGGGFFYVNVEYGLFEAVEAEGQDGSDGSEPPPETTEDEHLGSEFSFSSGGGTEHITQSIETIYPANNGGPQLFGYGHNGAIAPNTQKGIGVTKEGVAGCDIVVPHFEFSYSRHCEFITMRYVKRIVEATGTYNLTDWHTFKAGEVLMMGMEGRYSGNGNSDESWVLTYKFAVSKNKKNLKLREGLVVAEKLGWHYLWVGFVDEVAENSLLKLPKYAYVERVYEPMNFRQVLGF